MSSRIKAEPGFWPIIIAGTIATTVASLGIHIWMLQVLGIPYPDRSSVSAWAVFLNAALATWALMTFYAIVRPELSSIAKWQRWLLVAALFAMLKELFRGNIMNAVVTTAWIYSAAQIISPALYSLVLAALVVLLEPRLKGMVARSVAALAVTAIMTFAIKPGISMLLAPLMEAVAPLNHEDVYPFPYGWYVLTWAYVTYLEPVLICIVAASLFWKRLDLQPRGRLVQFTGLVVLIKGALLPTFLFSLWNSAGVSQGMLSESQFLFEAILLGLFGGAAWALARRHLRAREAPQDRPGTP